MKKISVFAIAFFILLALLLFLPSCAQGNSSSSDSGRVRSESNGSYGEKNEAGSNDNLSFNSVDDVIAVIESTGRETLGDQFIKCDKHVDGSVKSVILYIEVEGGAQACTLNLSSWEDVKDNIDDLTGNCRGLLVAAGYSDWHAAAFVLNDLNNSLVLYSSVDGVELPS